MKYLALEKTVEDIAIITIDCPGSDINSVSSGLLNEITELIERQVFESVQGIVVLSGKKDSFIVGADIHELLVMPGVAEVESYIAKANTILASLSAMDVPVVAAIHGSCLGGGLELALAAHYRIATDSSLTVFGLPEVMLGVFPAAGGIHRLPRQIGLMNALPLILTGSSIRVKKARRLGLIDEIVPVHGLREIAVQKAQSLAGHMGSKLHKKRGKLRERILESNPVGRAIVFSRAADEVHRKTMGLYPALTEILHSMAYGYRKGISRAIEKDCQSFATLATSPESRALMGIFFGMRNAKKKFATKKPYRVKKLAVIGAGLMGSGIASVSTGVCDTIIIKDRDIDTVATGMKGIWKGLCKLANAGAITDFERDTRYGKMVPADDYQFFRNTDLVIEAVYEDISLKKRILAEVENSTDRDTVFASNTSAIPIANIAARSRRPENVIGMHYFSPVRKMPLLEIIRTAKTSERTLAMALDLGRRQGKTCIVVRDGPGFYTTRILAPYLMEACLLVAEGAAMNGVDRALKEFGYPVGPISLIDEIGVDVAVHVSRVMAPLFSKRGISMQGPLDSLVEKGFLGRKKGIGIYRYDRPRKKGARVENKEIYTLLNAHAGPVVAGDICRRVALLMVNEAVLCLEEEILDSPESGDLGAVLGLGFPPFRGGPFRYIDTVGAESVVAELESLAERYGPRFTPAGLLVSMKTRGKMFYP